MNNKARHAKQKPITVINSKTKVADKYDRISDDELNIWIKNREVKHTILNGFENIKPLPTRDFSITFKANIEKADWRLRQCQKMLVKLKATMSYEIISRETMLSVTTLYDYRDANYRPNIARYKKIKKLYDQKMQQGLIL